MIHDSQLDEAERRAREAGAGDYYFEPESGNSPSHDWLCYIDSPSHLAHVLGASPAFTLQLIAELRWSRAMLERAKDYALQAKNTPAYWGANSPYFWLSELEAGPGKDKV